MQTLYYLQPDALGSARVAIDPVRDVAVWRWDLSDDAFGASPPQEDPDGDGAVFRLDLRFPGQRFDAVSGMYHNYFRDYDPTVGRYVQSDPIGLLGGMSTYGYANHSPATFSDPMGLFGKKIGGGIANMLVRPIVQRLGGGVAARAASAAAQARAQARRAAEMAQRMQTVLGRILKGRSSKTGAGSVILQQFVVESESWVLILPEALSVPKVLADIESISIWEEQFSGVPMRLRIFVDDVIGPISVKGPIPARGSVKCLANSAIKDVRFNAADGVVFCGFDGA